MFALNKSSSPVRIAVPGAKSFKADSRLKFIGDESETISSGKEIFPSGEDKLFKSSTGTTISLGPFSSNSLI